MTLEILRSHVTADNWLLRKSATERTALRLIHPYFDHICPTLGPLFVLIICPNLHFGKNKKSEGWTYTHSIGSSLFIAKVFRHVLLNFCHILEVVYLGIEASLASTFSFQQDTEPVEESTVSGQSGTGIVMGGWHNCKYFYQESSLHCVFTMNP